jgi:hypothetical protein
MVAPDLSIATRLAVGILSIQQDLIQNCNNLRGDKGKICERLRARRTAAREQERRAAHFRG